MKVFDVRALRPLPPITFPAIPSFVRFHPRMSSTLFIASALGQLQILDFVNPVPSTAFYQLDSASYITNLSIAASGEGLAYTDADGFLHLWTTAADPDAPRGPLKWSRTSKPVELPDDHVHRPEVPFDWANDETPLSSVGMPYYSTELLSVLPVQSYVTPYSPFFQPRPVIEPELLLAAHKRQLQFQAPSPSQYPYARPTHQPVENVDRSDMEQVCYLPNPKKTKRYQASLPLSSSTAHTVTGRIGSHPSLGHAASEARRRLSIPLFRSEKEKEATKRMSRDRRRRESADAGMVEEQGLAGLNLQNLEQMPKWYRQVEIKYSKFGIEDFDFGCVYQLEWTVFWFLTICKTVFHS